MSTSESDADADAELATAAALAAAPGALQAGMRAPLFVLPDATGQPVALEQLLRRGPVLLHFYRGAWCSYGEQSLADFGATYEQVEALGAQALSISPDRRRGQCPWPVPDLYDAGLRVARSYGLAFALPERLQARYRELGYAPGEGGEWLAPLPAVYLLDR
jgi:peroxiredoxin